MTRKAKSTAPGDAEVKRLLMRYQCPVPFHAVRTRFLGSIASPELRVAPMEVLQDLWDGETPEFETIDDANELFAALIQGLWNRLTRHQDRKTPFRLTRLRSPINSKELKHFAQVRLDELEGFADGLFGGGEAIELPERAHEALKALGDLSTFFGAFTQFADEPGTAGEFAETVRNANELSYIAEKEINAAMLSCTRARRQKLTEQNSGRPTLH